MVVVCAIRERPYLLAQVNPLDSPNNSFVSPWSYKMYTLVGLS